MVEDVNYYLEKSKYKLARFINSVDYGLNASIYFDNPDFNPNDPYAFTGAQYVVYRYNFNTDEVTKGTVGGDQ